MGHESRSGPGEELDRSSFGSRSGLMFLVGLGTLLAELAHTRVLAFVLWNHLVYLTVTMAFCGFAFAGTLQALRLPFFQRPESEVVSRASLALAVSLLVSLLLAAWLPLRTPESLTQLASLLMLFVVNALLVVPYFLFGTLAAYLLGRDPQRSTALYGANLVGSGAGCVLFVVLLPSATAPGLIALVAGAFALVAAWRERDRGRGLAAAGIATVVASVAINVWPSWISLHPEPSKGLASICKDPTKLHVEYTEWNPLSRVDVVRCRDREPSFGVFLYDSAAGAEVKHDLWRPGDPTFNPMRQRWGLRTFVYAMRPGPPKVLVLGAGGGLDVQMALASGASDVTAVEIHSVTTHLLHDVYDAQYGGLFRQPYVHLVNEDGRSFVQQTRQRFDVIAMVGIDSFTALSTGAYVLYESYIYTREAIADYFAHLTDDGIVSISRWVFRDRPRETLRLFATAHAALRGAGIAAPLDHMMVVRDGDWGALLIGRQPLSARAVERLAGWLQPYQEMLFRPDRFPADPARPNAFENLARAITEGREDAFLASYPYDVSPVTDDSPFFFQYTRLGSIGRIFRGGSVAVRELIQGNWTWVVIGLILLQAAVLAGFILRLPRRAGLRLGATQRPSAVLFATLGLGYALLQMALVQKLVLFLSHPVMSIAVVVPTLLVFGGIGSAASERLLPPRRAAAISLLVLPGLILAYRFGLDPALAHLGGTSLTLRALVVVLVLAPLGLGLGLPFANALRMTSDRDPNIVPWAFALNGAMSVIGSTSAVFFAMISGFSGVLALAALTYAVAALACLAWLRAGPRSPAAPS